MQNNPQSQPQKRPVKPGARPALPGKRPPQAQSRSTTSYREDPPPGMGGGEQPYAPQAYQAQSGAPAQHANTGYVQGQTPYYGPQAAQPSGPNLKAFGGIGIGVLLVVGGIIATMVSYNSAGPGGRYTIWWGPVVFGGITVIGGIAALFKK